MAAPTKTAKEALDEFFHRGASEKNWHLAQKSEQLLFDQVAEPEEKMNETFVWRKKNQKIGLDKLDPQQMLMVNKLKQEETAVRSSTKHTRENSLFVVVVANSIFSIIERTGEGQEAQD